MSNSRPLEIYMLPFLSFSHMIPLSEIGHLFSSAGQNVTILTTPHNASSLLKKTTDSPNFRVQTFPFPAKQVGLPDGLENFLSAKDIPTASKLYAAMILLQADLESFMLSNPPDVIISDMFFPWTADFDSGKKIITREKIENAVRKLMDGEDGMVKEMRRKIKELGEMAKKAVQVGGSSHKNLMVLIEELKKLRDH